MKDKLLTLGEVAEKLRISLGYARNTWPSWINFGVNPIRIGGHGYLLFKESEIEKMIEQWRVMRK